MRYKSTYIKLLEEQVENSKVVIGKAVIESMLGLIPNKGMEMATIPVLIDGYEFEVYVIMK